jgi:4-hydroxyphenylpyruvate dioxygenase
MKPLREPLRAESTLYDRGGDGGFLHFFTRPINGQFFEVLERRGGYDCNGAATAPARLAAQAMLDRSLGKAITKLCG